MSRDRSARTRIREFLSAKGSVHDPSGYATTLLKDAINYSGSSVAFIQLIAAMERDDEIVRDIRGKRTYRISASESTVKAFTEIAGAPALVSAGTSLGSQGFSIDYDALARAIVRELWAVTAAGAKAPVQAEVPDDRALRAKRDDYTRRIESARRQLDELLSEAESLASEPTVQH